MRMALFLQRTLPDEFMTPDWAEHMDGLSNCLNCRACVAKCPYNLDIPSILKKNLDYYRTFRTEYLQKTDAP